MMRVFSVVTFAGVLLLLSGVTLGQTAKPSCAAPDWSSVTESSVVWHPCTADGCEAYLGQVRDKVRGTWTANPITAKAKNRDVVQVRVTFHRDGSVETEYAVKTKNDKLNNAAQEAVLFSSPFPEFPSHWKQQEIVTCVSFFYAPPGKK